MSQASTLKTRGGINIPPFLLHKDNIINQSHVFIGGSDSGKSTFVNYILDTVGDSLPMIWVLSPTEPQNNSYRGRIPPEAIRVEVDDDIAIEFLTELWQRQEIASTMHRKASNIDTLIRLFHRVGSPQEVTAELRKLDKFELYIRQYTQQLASKCTEPDQQNFITNEKNRWEDSIKRQRVALYRTAILASRKSLLKSADLNEDEKHCLTYLTFSPHAGIIMDDCLASLTKTKSSPILAKIMTRGRHVNLTSFLVLHAVSDLPPQMRNNAFKTYFTAPQVATIFFDNTRGGFSKIEQKRAKDAIETIYTQKYRVLIYVRGAPEPYQHLMSKKTEPRRLCSNYFWKFCSEVGIGGTTIDKNNAFYGLFCSKTN